MIPIALRAATDDLGVTLDRGDAAVEFGDRSGDADEVLGAGLGVGIPRDRLPTDDGTSVPEETFAAAAAATVRASRL